MTTEPDSTLTLATALKAALIGAACWLLLGFAIRASAQIAPDATATVMAVSREPLANAPIDQICYYVIDPTPERELGCVLREDAVPQLPPAVRPVYVLEWGPEPPGTYIVVARAWRGPDVSVNSNTRSYMWLAPVNPPAAPLLLDTGEPPPDDGLVIDWHDGDPPDLGPIDVPGEALTITARVYATSFLGASRDSRIISKATSTSEQDHWWMLSTSAVGVETRLRFRLRTNDLTTRLVAASGDVPIGVWVNAAAVYDGATMRLYQDGVEVGSVAKSGPIDVEPTVSAMVGNQPAGTGDVPWMGVIDNVRVYSRALSAAELLQMGGVGQ